MIDTKYSPIKKLVESNSAIGCNLRDLGDRDCVYMIDCLINMGVIPSKGVRDFHEFEEGFDVLVDIRSTYGIGLIDKQTVLCTPFGPYIEWFRLPPFTYFFSLKLPSTITQSCQAKESVQKH